MSDINERTATELFQIIDIMPLDYKSKIPNDFMKLINNKKKSVTEKINIDDINTNNLSEDTKSYLAYIYLNYLLNDQEKENYRRILKENQERYEQKVDISNILEKRNIEIENKYKNNDTSLTVVKEKNFIEKIFDKIKNLLKRLH